MFDEGKTLLNYDSSRLKKINKKTIKEDYNYLLIDFEEDKEKSKDLVSLINI